MLWSLLGIVVGLAVLAYAADQFVLGAVRIAASLRLSTVVIGAVVVGFGLGFFATVFFFLAAAGATVFSST